MYPKVKALVRIIIQVKAVVCKERNRKSSRYRMKIGTIIILLDQALQNLQLQLQRLQIQQQLQLQVLETFGPQICLKNLPYLSDDLKLIKTSKNQRLSSFYHQNTTSSKIPLRSLQKIRLRTELKYHFLICPNRFIHLLNLLRKMLMMIL